MIAHRPLRSWWGTKVTPKIVEQHLREVAQSAQGRTGQRFCRPSNLPQKHLPELHYLGPACRGHGFLLLSVVLANSVRKLLERGDVIDPAMYPYRGIAYTDEGSIPPPPCYGVTVNYTKSEDCLMMRVRFKLVLFSPILELFMCRTGPKRTSHHDRFFLYGGAISLSYCSPIKKECGYHERCN